MRTMSPLSFEMMRPVCRSTSSGAVHRPSYLPPSVQWLYTWRRSAAPQSGSGSEAEKHLGSGPGSGLGLGLGSGSGFRVRVRVKG